MSKLKNIGTSTVTLQKNPAWCLLGQVERKVDCRADGCGQDLPPRPVQTRVLGSGGGGGCAGGPGAGRVAVCTSREATSHGDLSSLYVKHIINHLLLTAQCMAYKKTAFLKTV